MGLGSTQEKIKWVWILTILHKLVYFSCNLLGGCIWCNQVNLRNSATKTQEWRCEDFFKKHQFSKQPSHLFLGFFYDDGDGSCSCPRNGCQRRRPSPPQSKNYNLESNLINHKFTELKIHVSRSMARQLCCADTWCHICMAHRLDCGDTRDVNGTYSIRTSEETNYSTG